MTATNGHTLLKRLLDAGMHFTEMSQSTAEKIVNDFVKAGEVRRKDAAKAVQELVERGRSSSGQAMSAAQSELAKQLGRLADQLDGLETRIEDLAKSVGVKTAAARGEEGTGREEGAGREEGSRREEGTGREEGACQEAGRRLVGCRQGRDEEGHEALTRVASAARLDAELVRRGLTSSRTEAARAIAERRVLVNGAVAEKTARLVDPGDAVLVTGAAAAVREPRRREVGCGPRLVPSRRRRDGSRSTPAPRPAGSPTACCSVVPAMSSHSTSGTGSCTRASATTSE